MKKWVLISLIFSFFLFLYINNILRHKKIREEGMLIQKIVIRYPNGRTKERYYVIRDNKGNFIKHGRYIAKYENGQISRACNYKYGVKVGREVFWDENGRTKRQVLYENGKVIIDLHF